MDAEIDHIVIQENTEIKDDKCFCIKTAFECPNKNICYKSERKSTVKKNKKQGLKTGPMPESYVTLILDKVLQKKPNKTSQSQNLNI